VASLYTVSRDDRFVRGLSFIRYVPAPSQMGLLYAGSAVRKTDRIEIVSSPALLSCLLD
jgi:hypothetical protein